MSQLEASALEAAIALNKFSSAIDAIFRERVKTLTQQWNEGELSPRIGAQFDLQDRMTKLVRSGRFTSAQARALSAAFQAWKPPLMEDSKNG